MVLTLTLVTRWASALPVCLSTANDNDNSLRTKLWNMPMYNQHLERITFLYSCESQIIVYLLHFPNIVIFKFSDTKNIVRIHSCAYYMYYFTVISLPLLHDLKQKLLEKFQPFVCGVFLFESSYCVSRAYIRTRVVINL